MPATSRKDADNKSAAEKLPAFDSQALSTLTKSIESKLMNKDAGSLAKTSSVKPKKEKSKKKQKDDAKSPSGVQTLKSSVLKESTGIPPALTKQKAPHSFTSHQGKKRTSDGKIKNAPHQKSVDSVNRTRLGTRTPKPVLNGQPDISEDIRALGGTQDDIELITGAPSDSEIEGEHVGVAKAASGDLSKELQQLIRQLGVDKVGQEDQIGEFVEEEDYDSDGKNESITVNRKDTTGLTDDINLEEPAARPSRKGHASLAFQPLSEWHAAELPVIPDSEEKIDLPQEVLNRVQEHAKSLLEKENKEYAAHDKNASSAHQFYSTIMSTGTLSDKISALTLSVQESPVHNVKALETLVGLARKRSRGQAVEVLGALKDLFGPGNLLPSDRKLRPFAAQPALCAAFEQMDFQWTPNKPLPEPLKSSHLISWAYEDWLKSTFFEVLKIMESWSNDEVTFARGKAVDYMCQLLKEKPEQEANLLRLLVNKLGDSDKKIASKTSFNILQLETTHPLMKPTIISAIESDLLFRPGQNLHAKYYATITLNQTVLSGKEEGVARKLLDIYFTLFVKLLEKPKPVKLAATGVNSITINRKGEVQGGGGAGGKKAQKKLAGKEKATTVDEELREKMLSAVLTGVNRAIPFTNTNDESFEKHLHTLFRVTHSSNFNTSIQALILIQQLNGSHQGSVDRFYRTLYESLLDPRLLTSSKQALYLNLLFRALRSDLNIKRIKAFAKRILQVVTMHQPSITCGTLYLLRELESVFANLETFIDQPEEDEEEEENFRDVEEPTTDDQTLQKSQSQPPIDDIPQPPTSKNSRQYDGRKRDPEHSNASHSSLWELTLFLHHYHPSVSLFATRLSTHAPMPPKPDLALNTLIHFLDRFVYRNPKSVPTLKGSSIMQPMAGGDSSAQLVSAYSGKERRAQPVNSEAFWRQESGTVGADEVFFHKYFSSLGKGKDKAKKKAEKKADKKRDGDSDASESEGDEDEIWKALVDSRPELEGSDGGVFSDEDLGSEMQALADEDDDDGAVILDDGRSDDDGGEAMGDEHSLDLEDGDEGAILDSEDEVPSDLDDALIAEVQAGKNNAGKQTGKTPMLEGEEGETRGKKRRRLRNLPTFASADDYTKMVEGDN